MSSKVQFSCIVLVFIALITASCNEEPYNVEKETSALVLIKKSYEEGLYDRSIELAREFKARYPYAHSNIEIDLIIADSHFKLREFLEAILYFTRFIKLYPHHAQKPYALYQIGRCYWEEAPGAIDREQDSTIKAVTKWKKLVKAYPKSPHAAKAKILMRRGEKRILESQKFITSYYCNNGLWASCAYRALEISEEFPQYPKAKKEALKLSAKAFKELAKNKRRGKEEKNIYSDKLSADELEERAKSFLKEAEKLSL